MGLCVLSIVHIVDSRARWWKERNKGDREGAVLLTDQDVRKCLQMLETFSSRWNKRLAFPSPRLFGRLWIFCPRCGKRKRFILLLCCVKPMFSVQLSHPGEKSIWQASFGKCFLKYFHDFNNGFPGDFYVGGTWCYSQEGELDTFAALESPFNSFWNVWHTSGVAARIHFVFAMTYRKHY